MPDPQNENGFGRLRTRAEFVHVAGGRRWHGRALTLQARERAGEPGAGEPVDAVRFGFTLTKRVGSAVVRNRARRRLKEAVRLADDLPVRPGMDYVVVGRIDAIRLPFAALKSEMEQALDVVHGAGRQKRASEEERRGRPGAQRQPVDADRQRIHGRGAKRIRPEP